MNEPCANGLDNSIEAVTGGPPARDDDALHESEPPAVGAERTAADAYVDELLQSLRSSAALPASASEVAAQYRLAMKAEIMCMEHGFEDQLAWLSLQIGDCLESGGFLDWSLARFSAALKVARLYGDVRAQLGALERLARHHLDNTRFSQADIHLEEASRHVVQLNAEGRGEGHAGRLLQCHGDLAAALVACGRPHYATSVCERAFAFVGLDRDSGLPRQMAAIDAPALDGLSRMHLMQGRPDRAFWCAAALARQGRLADDAWALASACERLADLRLSQGRHAAACRWLERAERHWTRTDERDRRMRCLERLSDTLAESGRHARALAHARTFHDLTVQAHEAFLKLRWELGSAMFSRERDFRAETEGSEHAGRLACLGRMAISIAHEVTQPLSAIRLIAENAMAEHAGTVDACRTDTGHSSQDQALGRIVQLVEQLSAYVQHLKRSARREPVDVRAESLSRIVSDALAIVEPERKARGIDLALHVEDVAVLADAGRASAALVNLLCNAFEAAETTPLRQVHLVTVLGDAHGTVQVRDHGRGLGRETLARLFQPFYSTKSAGQGLGLGLCLSRDMARQMGAQVEGANHPDGGAVFTLAMRLVPETGHAHAAGGRARPRAAA